MGEDILDIFLVKIYSYVVCEGFFFRSNEIVFVFYMKIEYILVVILYKISCVLRNLILVFRERGVKMRLEFCFFKSI